MMITGEWNSQRKTSINKQDPGNVEDARKENERIPGGWSRQREASNTRQSPGPVESIPGG